MRRFGRRLKSFTAVLLSACLVFPLGAVNAWAEEPEYPAAAAEETILPDITAEAAAEAAVEAGRESDAAGAAVEAALEAGQGADAAVVEAVAETEPGVTVEETFYAEAGTASASDAINAAEEEQSVTAGAENESEAAASTATASDAQFDEDGFLLDGEVVDDVEEEPELTDEIIAPEMITEVIGKKEAGPPAWLTDYDYDTDNTNKIVTLKKYNGNDADIYVPATAKIAGVTYDIAIGQAKSYKSNWAGTYVHTISFEDGVRMPADMTAMFSGCYQLTSVDLSNLDTSHVTSMREMFKECWRLTSLDLRDLDTSSVTEMREMFGSCLRLEEINFGSDNGGYSRFRTNKVKDMAFMFYNCEALEQLDLSTFDMSKVTSAYRMFYDSYSLEFIKTPRFCNYDVELPSTMQERGGTVLYDKLPRNLSYSVELADPTKYVFVTSINLNTTVRTLAKGSTFQLKAWPQPVNATNKDVRWMSYMDSVASVDSNGLVTAHEEGYALIVCESRDFEGPTAYCEIMVGTPVTGIVINTTAKSLEVGETFQVKGWAKPNNATNRTVLYSSDNPAVAAVDEDGHVTALKGGIANITAKTQDHGYTATCKITVNLHVTGVKINTTARTIEAGKTFQLAAWPQPANATNKAVTWTSSNPAVAKVSSTGLVTGVKNGTANITVKTVDGGYTATCKITVGIPVTSLVINTTARTILAGKTFQLAAWPQPANASNRAVTWISNNPAIATVNSSGLVTGVKDGYAVITVKTVDGGYTKTCAITVGIPVTGVVINTKAKTMNVGKTFQLAAWPQPANASNKAVTWTSSNTAVATVSATGLVTAKKKGTATITVKTVDAGYTETCTITAQ